MMGVEQAVSRVNRAVILTWVVHVALGLLVLGAMIVGPAAGVSQVLVAAIPLTIWVLLAFNGMRETRNAMHWPSLIASGQLDEAERQIEIAIRGFSMLRSVKLMSLHHLAVLRMAQRRWQDASDLSAALLSYRLPREKSLTRASLMVLANAAVQIGNLSAAYGAIGRLRGDALLLDERLGLLNIESLYLVKIGAWRSLLSGIDVKARMAELMPCEMAAQTQACLALGARRAGRGDWESYLKERVGLLCEAAKLYAEEPLLRELWSEPASGTRVEAASVEVASVETAEKDQQI